MARDYTGNPAGGHGPGSRRTRNNPDVADTATQVMPETGLSSAEAAERLKALGPAETHSSRSTSSIIAGNVFTLFNLHWDHRSQVSRERGAQLLLDRIRNRGNPQDRVLVTGDFNAGEENPAFRALLEAEDPSLKDPFRVRFPEAREVGTFHGFNGGSEGEKIDAILVGPGWEVLDAAIHRASFNGRYPSDHHPVTAVLGWGSEGFLLLETGGPKDGHGPGVH